MNAIPSRRGARWLRIARGLLLALTLLPGLVGPPTPTHADEPIVRDHRDPDARVLLVVKKIIVHEDYDWGAGEINIGIFVRANGTPCDAYDGPACGRLLVESAIPEFEASDGTVKAVNRYVPSYLDSIVDSETSPDLGIPIHLGDWYGLTFIGTESDPVTDDPLGQLGTSLLDEQGRVRFGTFTERSDDGCPLLPRPASRFCGPGRGVPGPFSVEYEIRYAQLPDLRPYDLKLYDLPGSSKKLACAAIVNDGFANAGPFDLAVLLDGAAQPVGRISAGGLARGQSGELCAELALPTTGRHQLTALVDPARAVPEAIETNNRFEQVYFAPGSGPGSPPSGPMSGNGGINPASATPLPEPTLVTASPTPSRLAPTPTRTTKQKR